MHFFHLIFAHFRVHWVNHVGRLYWHDMAASGIRPFCLLALVDRLLIENHHLLLPLYPSPIYKGGGVNLGKGLRPMTVLSV